MSAMRRCVIFNPTARGEGAKRFRRHLDAFGGECALKPTTAPGGGRALAAEAVREGFGVIVAAGGDGTLNEVLNGIEETLKARFNIEHVTIQLETESREEKEYKAF